MHTPHLLVCNFMEKIRFISTSVAIMMSWIGTNIANDMQWITNWEIAQTEYLLRTMSCT